MMASSSHTDHRQALVNHAKLALLADLYDDMAQPMMKLVDLGVILTSEERMLLNLAFKKSVQTRRSSLIILKSCNDHHDHDDLDVLIREYYRQTIESEISDICNDAVWILDNLLIPYASNVDYEVYYLKLKGDYYRYLAEIHVGSLRQKLAEESLKAYEMAAATAEADMAPTHPVRLGVALNMSVLYYDVLKSQENAFEVAEGAYGEALPELVMVDDREDAFYKATIANLSILGDNLTLWKKNMQEEDDRSRNME